MTRTPSSASHRWLRRTRRLAVVGTLVAVCGLIRSRMIDADQRQFDQRHTQGKRPSRGTAVPDRQKQQAARQGEEDQDGQYWIFSDHKYLPNPLTSLRVQ